MIMRSRSGIVEEDENIYGEYGEMVDKRLEPTSLDLAEIG